MSDEYYIQNSEGEKQGPYTHYQLTGMKIDVNTSVLPSSTNKWQKACDLPELNDYFEARGYWFPTEDNLASFWWRLLAYFIDAIIFAIVFVIVAYFLKIDISKFNAMNDKNALSIQLAVFGMVIIYNGIFEATPLRGSLGKQLCRLAVVDADGKRLTPANSLLRNFSRILSNLICNIGYLAILWDSHCQAWHDQIAKTYVIKRG